MPDLVVNDDLTRSQSNLAVIDDEFKGASDDIKQETGTWGQADLASAMWDFVDDWWIHRDRMEKKIGDLKDNVDQAVDGWNQTEQNLTQGITVQHQGAVNGPSR